MLRTISWKTFYEDAVSGRQCVPWYLAVKTLARRSCSRTTRRRQTEEGVSLVYEIIPAGPEVHSEFLANQLAYFIRRLRTTNDPFPSGSLFDNSIVLDGCSTSKTHLARYYPLILSGGQTLRFQHGQPRLLDEDKHRMSDLYLAVLQQLGMEADRFADSRSSSPRRSNQPNAVGRTALHKPR